MEGGGSTSWRRVTARVGLILGSLALTFGLSELAARLLWQEPRPAGIFSVPKEDDLVSFRDLLGPNISGINRGVPYETNRYGFRDQEYPLEKPREVFRIVVIGDSVTMGSGVQAEEAYPSVLERALNQERRRTSREFRYEVLNLGLSGLSLHGAIRRLQNIGLKFDPDLILYGFTLNDLEGPAYRKTSTRGLRIPESSSYVLRLVGARWAALRELVLPDRGSYVYELDWNYFRNPDVQARFFSGLDLLAQIAQAHGVCVHMLVHAAPYHLHGLHPFRRHYDFVADAAAERGFHVTQSLPYFLGREPSEVQLSPSDPHPNPMGHWLLAQALLDDLDTLPQSCRTDTRPVE